MISENNGQIGYNDSHNPVVEELSKMHEMRYLEDLSQSDDELTKEKADFLLKNYFHDES